MISLSKRIDAFANLGKVLINFEKASISQYKNTHVNALEQAVLDSTHYNGWFIEANVRFMLNSIGRSLSRANLSKWLTPYKNLETNSTKTIGVVMAGNVPLVGFHDFLCVLISGNSILAKLSSDDDKLLPLVAEILFDIEPGFKDMVIFTSGQLKKIDAIIATGSNNTSRYFEYYFGKYPNIIRKNRNGIAVLTGAETKEELENINFDISMYFGLGCRNVSHIFVPEGYDFNSFLQVCESNESTNSNHKYFNNYEYNKAIYLVGSVNHFDSGNILLVEDSNFSTPVSVISYEYYSNIEDIVHTLEINKKSIQCIISISKEINGSFAPGTSQSPELWDYADGVDTIEFLTNL